MFKDTTIGKTFAPLKILTYPDRRLFRRTVFAVSLVGLLVESAILCRRHRWRGVSSCLKSGKGVLRPIVAEDMCKYMSGQRMKE